MKVTLLALALALTINAAAQSDSSVPVTISGKSTYLQLFPDTSHIVAAIATCSGCAVVAKAGVYITSQRKFLVRDGGNNRKKYVPLKDYEIVLGYVTCDNKSIWFKK